MGFPSSELKSLSQQPALPWGLSISQPPKARRPPFNREETVEAAGEGSRPHLLIAAREPKREYRHFSNTRSRRLWSGAFIRELSTKSSSLEKTQVTSKHTQESCPKLRFFWEHGIAQLCNKSSLLQDSADRYQTRLQRPKRTGPPSLTAQRIGPGW